MHYLRACKLVMGILALLREPVLAAQLPPKSRLFQLQNGLKKFLKKNGKLYFYNTTQMKLLSTFATVIAFTHTATHGQTNATSN